MQSHKPIFVISLDFELFWGIRDTQSLQACQERLLGARTAIPKLLELFKTYNIHATWATVGFLFFDNKQNLLNKLPHEKPGYLNKMLCPYENIRGIGNSESEDPYHFGLSLINKIKSYAGQEIGSHTFSHYYTLEKGQTIEAFTQDLESAINIANCNNTPISSLVFPRNQCNQGYLNICYQHGIRAYRGNNPTWPHCESLGTTKDSLFKRIFRLLDSLINLTGHHCYQLFSKPNQILSIPASRFLRPYSKKTALLKKIELVRLKSSLLHAAKRDKIFHLWWHPHNFGIYIDENLSYLKNILEYYQYLKKKYNMQSLNMKEVTSLIQEEQP